MASRRARVLSAALGLAGVTLTASPAAAQYPTDTPVPDNEVDGVVFEQQLDRSRVSAAAQADTSSLPVTGGDLLGLSAIGAGAVAAGIVITRRRSGAAHDHE